MTEQTSPADPGARVPADGAERSIIVDLWNVADGDQDEFLSVLVELFERLRECDGFIDGQILRGVNPSLFISYATMRSARARDAALADPQLRATTRRLGGVAHG